MTPADKDDSHGDVGYQFDTAAHVCTRAESVRKLVHSLLEWEVTVCKKSRLEGSIALMDKS